MGKLRNDSIETEEEVNIEFEKFFFKVKGGKKNEKFSLKIKISFFESFTLTLNGKHSTYFRYC